MSKKILHFTTLRTTTSAILLGATTLSSPGYAQSTSGDKTLQLQIQALEAQLSEVKANNQALQSQMQSLETQLGDMKTDELARQRRAIAAQSTPSPAAASSTAAALPALPADDSLTMYGVTVYGTVDIGVAYQNHGATFNGDSPWGLEYLVQKNSNKSVLSVAPNALSQSKVGVKATEPISDDLSGVFKVETGFNPASGMLASGLKSLVDNNGVALANQSTNGDSSRAGQAFNGEVYAGLSSKTYGTLTVGRHNSLMLDAVNSYDPQGASNAFSVIGYSGATAGIGDTEDARLDNSLKYAYKYGPGRFSGMYAFGGSDGLARSAYEFDIGGDYDGLSVDALYSHVADAISAATVGTTPASLGITTLAGTISDDTSYAMAAKYVTGPWKFYGAYEHIQFDNPATALTVGTTIIGGFELSAVNNAAYTNNKVLEVTWTGVKYAVLNDLDLTGAFYHYYQNSYKGNGCSNNSASSCSGNLNALSMVLDYKLTKRFDLYGGAMYSKVTGGLSNSYLHTDSIDPMVGGRFNF